MAFEYVSIPQSVAQSRKLSWNEKAILGFMMGFKGRFRASNVYVAECLGMCPKTVENTLTRMRKKGLIAGRKPLRSGGGTPTIREVNPYDQGVKTPTIREHIIKNKKDDRKEDNKGGSLSVVEEKKENDEVAAALPKPAGCPLAAREANKALGLRAVLRSRRNSALERRESLA